MIVTNGVTYQLARRNKLWLDTALLSSILNLVPLSRREEPIYVLDMVFDPLRLNLCNLSILLDRMRFFVHEWCLIVWNFIKLTIHGNILLTELFVFEQTFLITVLGQHTSNWVIIWFLSFWTLKEGLDNWFIVWDRLWLGRYLSRSLECLCHSNWCQLFNFTTGSCTGSC